jgi:hypothetical protein
LKQYVFSSHNDFKEKKFHNDFRLGFLSGKSLFDLLHNHRDELKLHLQYLADCSVVGWQHAEKWLDAGQREDGDLEAGVPERKP